MKLSAQQARERLVDLVKGGRVGMLTTVDADGSLRSRPMLTYCNGPRVLWLFVRANASGGQDPRDGGQVNVAFADSLSDHYVSLSGLAELEQDRRRMADLWNPALKAWFPAGLDEPDLTLMRVTVQRAELWDARSTGLAQFLAVARNLSGRGDHRTSIHEAMDFRPVSP